MTVHWLLVDPGVRAVDIDMYNLHWYGSWFIDTNLRSVLLYVYVFLILIKVLCLCSLLQELFLLLQPIAFKIPAHLGMVSFALKNSGSHVLTLLLPAPLPAWSCRGLLSRTVICKFFPLNK